MMLLNLVPKFCGTHRNAATLSLIGGLLLPQCAHTQAPESQPVVHEDSAPPPAAGKQQPQNDTAWRHKRPDTSPLPSLNLPLGHKKQFANGLTLVAVQKEALPLVHISVVIKSGSAQDPAKLEGLAAFMVDMLKMGTPQHSAQAIAEAVEIQGASLVVGTDEDSLFVSASVLKENLPKVLDVIADVVRHPTFAEHEVQRLRKLKLSNLSQLNSDPVYLSRRVFRQVIFGPHAYGHTSLGTAAGLQHIRRQDLKAFYDANVGAANTAVVLVGDLSASEAEEHVTSRFADWHGPAQTQTPPSPPADRAPQIVLVPRPGAPQSQVVVGHLGVSRDTKDYYPLIMCNAILGGLFNSRINMNLREDKGWTYGARSTFDFKRERGPFFVATGIRTDVTGDAIREILREVAKMRDTDVSQEELADAKNRYSLSLPGYFQTVEGISSMLANLYVNNLPDDYYQQLPANLAAVTVADVRRAATSYLHPDNLSIVVVGDPVHVSGELTNLGRGAVLQLDGQGNPSGAAKQPERRKSSRPTR